MICMFFCSRYVYCQYDSIRYDMTKLNVHWNSLTDYNSKGFNPDTLSKPLYCQSETTPSFILDYSRTNDFNDNVATAKNVLDAGSHYAVAGIYTKKHYNLTTHTVRVKGSFVCRTTNTGELNEYWLGAIPVSNTNYHSAIYGGGNTPVGFIIGAWVDWWCARDRGNTIQPDKFFENRVNSNMPLGLFFEASAEFRIIHDSLVVTNYTLTPPVDDMYKKQSWVYPVYRQVPFESFKDADWFKDFRPAFMPDDGLDWVEVVADPLPCVMELKQTNISICEDNSKSLDLSKLIWLKNQSIDNKTGTFYLRKSSNTKSVSFLHKSLTNALLPAALPSGQYSVCYVSPCGDSIHFPLVVLPKPDVYLSDTSLCKGVIFKPNVRIMSATSIGKYSWRCGTNMGSTSQPIWQMSDTGHLMIILGVEDMNGCGGSDTAEIYVSNLGNVQIIVNDSDQCFDGHVFDLKADCITNSKNQYRWELSDSSSYFTQSVKGVKFPNRGIYRAVLYVSNPWGCVDSASSSLELFESPRVVLFDTQVCENQSFSPRIFMEPTSVSGLKFRWFCNNTDSILRVPPVYTMSEKGQYSVRVVLENSYGCSDTDDAVVVVHPRPILNYLFLFLDEQPGLTRWTYQYMGKLGYRVDWFENGAKIANGIGPGIVILNNLGKQRFKLRVISDHGCSDSIEFSKIISASNNIYFPNAFTPDGKGGNNAFGPYNAELIDNYILRIYNRWGEKIFESTENNRYWDGLDSVGSPAMEGQYVYIVTGMRNSGDLLNQAGTVYLLRNK